MYFVLRDSLGTSCDAGACIVLFETWRCGLGLMQLHHENYESEFSFHDPR